MSWPFLSRSFACGWETLRGMKTIRTLLWIAAACCGLGASVPAVAAASGDPVALANLFQANVDPVHQCQAMATYRNTISWAHANGMRITGSPVPFFVDDIEDGNMALQDALDGVAFPPFGYDML